MRRGNDQFARELIAEFLPYVADVVGFAQRAFGEAMDVPPSRRQAGQAVTLADIVNPSSRSSSWICLLTPGWEV